MGAFPTDLTRISTLSFCLGFAGSTEVESSFNGGDWVASVILLVFCVVLCCVGF